LQFAHRFPLILPKRWRLFIFVGDDDNDEEILLFMQWWTNLLAQATKPFNVKRAMRTKRHVLSPTKQIMGDTECR
jgi:hypothetical protein